MSGTFVAQASAGPTGADTKVTMSITCLIHERIFVQVTAGTSGVDITSVTDGTNTYTAAGTAVYQTGPTGSRVFVCNDAAAVTGATLQGNYASSVNTRTIGYARYNSTDTNAPLGSARAGTNTGVANATSSGNVSGTLTQPNMYWGVCITGGSGLSVTAGTSPLSYNNDGAFSTRDAVFGYFSRIESCSTASTTNNPATFSLGAADFTISHGVCVGEPSGAATRPVKMAGEWGGYAGESGGFAGKPREAITIELPPTDYRVCDSGKHEMLTIPPTLEHRAGA